MAAVVRVDGPGAASVSVAAVPNELVTENQVDAQSGQLQVTVLQCLGLALLDCFSVAALGGPEMNELTLMRGPQA
jgi:hypothetical protein